MATGIIPQNPPEDMSLTRFRAIADNYGSLAKQCRFVVRINPIGDSVLKLATNMQDITYLCTAASLPGRGMDLMANRYYGPDFYLPRNSKYSESVDLAILCRSESNERKWFDDWLDIINPVDNWNFEYKDNYVAKIDVFQFAEYAPKPQQPSKKPSAPAPKAVYQWSLIDAYPMQIAEQQVSWADQDVLSLSVSFSYRYWTRPRVS